MAPTKIYLGKIFTLKNVHRIPWQSKNTKPSLWRPGSVGFEQGHLTKEEIGDRVLILDEAAKRVQVMTVKGMAIWVSKYYLHTEIREELTENPVGELGRVISDLAEVRKKFSKTSNKPANIDKKMNDIIRRVRKVQENLETEN